MSAHPVPPEVKAKIVKLYTDDKLTQGLIQQRLRVGILSIRRALIEAGIPIVKTRRETPFGPDQFP